MQNRMTDARASAPAIINPVKKITVKNLIIIMSLVAVAAAMVFWYLYTVGSALGRVEEPNIILNRPPGFIFNIYEGKDKLSRPISVTVDRAGSILVSNNELHTIELLSPNGKPRAKFGGPGQLPGQLYYPYGTGVLPDGNILVAETGNFRIQEFSPEGKFIKTFIGQPNNIGLEKPGPVTVDRKGRIYVGDLSAHRLYIIDRKGKVLRKIENIQYPHGIAVDEKHQKLYVSDAGQAVVKVYSLTDAEEGFVRVIKNYEPDKSFSMVRGLAVDKEGRLYVADTINSSIRVFAESGRYLFSFGGRGFDDGLFLYPNGIHIDENGKIYVADWGNNRVSVWSY